MARNNEKSVIDALSMLYAKNNLCSEDKFYENCKLYYRGIDKTRWDGDLFVYPICTDSDKDPCQSYWDESLRSEFEKIYYFEKDINDFLDERFINGRSKNVFHNIIFFPKILNELPKGTINKLCEQFAEMKFGLDEYYICVSHSPKHVFKDQKDDTEGANIIDRIVLAINGNGEFEVCSDIKEMLGDSEWGKFKTRWLAGAGEKDELIDVTEESRWNDVGMKVLRSHDDITLPPQHSCYSFRSMVDESNANSIEDLNEDFRKDNRIFGYFKDSLKPVLDEVYKKVNKEPLGNGPHVFPITRVSQIMFQVIRLKRKKP